MFKVDSRLQLQGSDWGVSSFSPENDLWAEVPVPALALWEVQRWPESSIQAKTFTVPVIFVVVSTSLKGICSGHGPRQSCMALPGPPHRADGHAIGSRSRGPQ